MAVDNFDIAIQRMKEAVEKDRAEARQAILEAQRERGGPRGAMAGDAVAEEVNHKANIANAVEEIVAALPGDPNFEAAIKSAVMDMGVKTQLDPVPSVSLNNEPEEASWESSSISSAKEDTSLGEITLHPPSLTDRFLLSASIENPGTIDVSEGGWWEDNLELADGTELPLLGTAEGIGSKSEPYIVAAKNSALEGLDITASATKPVDGESSSIILVGEGIYDDDGNLYGIIQHRTTDIRITAGFNPDSIRESTDAESKTMERADNGDARWYDVIDPTAIEVTAEEIGDGTGKYLHAMRYDNAGVPEVRYAKKIATSTDDIENIDPDSTAQKNDILIYDGTNWVPCKVVTRYAAATGETPIVIASGIASFNQAAGAIPVPFIHADVDNLMLALDVYQVCQEP